jgi:hypothetical protein
MVPSSALDIASDGERLTCDDFSLGKTVRLGSFELITDYFGDLSLAPRRGSSGATFMVSTRSGTPSPQWVMIEDSTVEFLMESSGGGGLWPSLS